MGLGEIRLGEMGLGEMGQNRAWYVGKIAVSRNTAPLHRPQLLVFRVWKRIESTCCDMKTCIIETIIEGIANDRPNYDVAW